MDITLFIGGLSNGGAERVTCNLANYLVGRGHAVNILTMSDVESSYDLSPDVSRTILLKNKEHKSFLYNSIIRIVRLLKYLRCSQTDIIVVLLPVTTILLLSMKWFSKSRIIAAERSLPSVYSNKIQSLLKKVAYRADGWVFQNEEQKKWYERAGVQKGVIIPNAINSSFIKLPYDNKRNCDIVIVGSLTRPKNHELLISAFSIISKEYPEHRLVIYGKGEKLAELQSFTKRMGITDKVNFAGYSTNVGERIINSCLFVLSSDYEGMPNALMEAMALGLPCISTDCDGGGAAFLIEDGVNGLLVPKGDVDALANAMRRMLSDRKLAESCGRNAHKICERLAPEKVYGQWEEFIKEVSEIN